jgi:hypothetical protein
MDDLFCYPDASAHGGANPAIKPNRQRARTSNSFRAAWEPVVSPDFGALRDPHALTAARALSLTSGAAVRAAVLPPPRPVPAINIGALPAVLAALPAVQAQAA